MVHYFGTVVCNFSLHVSYDDGLWGLGRNGMAMPLKNKHDQYYGSTLVHFLVYLFPTSHMFLLMAMEIVFEQRYRWAGRPYT